MSRTVTPVTNGGKIFWSFFGGTKLSSIVVKLHKAVVPMRYPNAAGQAALVLVPSAIVLYGQVPSAYRASKVAKPTGSVATQERNKARVNRCINLVAEPAYRKRYP